VLGEVGLYNVGGLGFDENAGGCCCDDSTAAAAPLQRLLDQLIHRHPARNRAPQGQPPDPERLDHRDTKVA
jgi:hypothetical protein